MFIIQRTVRFRKWFESLQDQRARTRILARLRSAAASNFGDAKSVGDGVFEMRIDVGPGYRLYFMRIGNTTYLLLLGGNKSSQKSDIVAAKMLAEEIRRQK